jgi:hypothetical protein
LFVISAAAWIVSIVSVALLLGASSLHAAWHVIIWCGVALVGTCSVPVSLLIPSFPIQSSLDKCFFSFSRMFKLYFRVDKLPDAADAYAMLRYNNFSCAIWLRASYCTFVKRSGQAFTVLTHRYRTLGNAVTTHIFSRARYEYHFKRA